jgi:hypothetical protein
MTLAEFFEFVVQETKQLDIDLRAYTTVFDGIKRVVSQYPDEPLWKKLCLTPDLLDGLLAQARNAPHLQGSRLSKYDSILEKLHPHGAPAPTLKAVEKLIAEIKPMDLN